MHFMKTLFLLAAISLLPTLLVGQVGVRPYPHGRGVGGNPHAQQCLQQAGLSQATMQQARSIRERAKAEIEALCANTSLTRQERQQRIQQIHQQTQQQTRSLISEAQQERLRSCQQGGRAPFGGGHGFGGGQGIGGGQGPCGSFPGESLGNERVTPGEPTAEPGK